jgi:hypothetical protein
MSRLIRSIMLTASLALIPAAAALAQSTAPHATTAQADQNPNTPGATGQTVVKGDNSTIKGDHSATKDQKTGASEGR